MDREFRKAIARLSRKNRNKDAESENDNCFFICEECGQAVDRRSLAQMFHHEEYEHKPLSEAELTELALAERSWTEARRNRKRK